MAQIAATDAETVAIAVSILSRLAEDCKVPPSYRVAARRHLKRLREGERKPLTADDFANV